MVTILRFRNGETELLSLEELLAMPPDQIPTDEMIWVDLFQPTHEEEHQVLKEWFPISDLELSDAHRSRSSFRKGMQHFPKVEEFDTHLFLIVRAAVIPERKHNEVLTTYLTRITGAQLNIFMNHRVVITHRWDDVGVVESIQRMLTATPKFALRGPDFAVAQLIDATVNDALRIAHLVEDRLEEIEEVILRTDDHQLVSSLMMHRRYVFLLRRAVIYQQEICVKLSTGESDFVDKDEAVYYRDVVDHHVRAADQLDLLRVMVDGLMDLYFSMTSNRLNQVMRVLTVISTVFLPITFVTSWYGMNFHHMPELGWAWGYPAVISVIATISLLMLFHAKRRGWFG